MPPSGSAPHLAARRFRVALSFPGEHRARVQAIASLLGDVLGRDKVLYDNWYEEEFARPNLDDYLSQLYHDDSELIVFFLCEDYKKKPWCRLEWRVAKDLLFGQEDERLMYLKVDSSEAAGLYRGDGYMPIQGKTDEEVAAKILKRLGVAAQVTTGREAYLTRLLAVEQKNARKYSELEGHHQPQPSSEAALLVEELFQDDLANIDYQPCERREMDAACAQSYPRLLEAFGHVKRAALLGAPGAGKSTTLRKLAVTLAAKALADLREPIPIFVTLGNWTGSESLIDFLNGRTPELGGGVRPLIDSGQALLLLDGLNEIPTGGREGKAEQIRQLPKKATLYVSCRQEDYRDKLVLGLDVLTLEPLTPERIRAAVEHWVTSESKPVELAGRFFWQLAANGDASEAEALERVFRKWLSLGATERQFWTVKQPNELAGVYAKTGGEEDALWQRHIPQERSLLRLAANPFMLVMLFTVWGRNHGKLPQNRGDLFRQFVDNLMNRLAKGEAVDEVQLRTGLANLAWRMQHEKTGEVDLGVLTVVPRAVVVEALGEQGVKKALDSTILEGEAEIRFRHQLLQEYFTARALEQRLASTPAAALWPPAQWWQRTGWEETAVLLAGLQARDCEAVIRWLADAQPEVAAQCMEESGADLPGKASLLAELGDRWRGRLLTEQRPEARAAVGRVLGRYHLDQRKGVGVQQGVPDIDWVKIPAGPFLYQDKKKPRALPAFEMARYPVTNAQYEAFLVAEDGYGQDRWWEGLSEPDRTPRSGAWGETNHPRERVSWFEAMAFCAWLSHKLGYEVSLPTEQQWERAARFTDGREYPWGNGYRDGYANIREDEYRLGRTSPVGLYPLGASQEGVLDLCGNVWEWCLNEYRKPERRQRSGREGRCLRGGSWFNLRGLARAGYRDGGGPGGRDDDVGFRVVCSAPIR